MRTESMFFDACAAVLLPVAGKLTMLTRVMRRELSVVFVTVVKPVSGRNGLHGE